MPFHGNSRIAASALEEAREQGKFDVALDVLFEKQPERADHGNPRAELISVFLAQVGVNLKEFDNAKLVVKHGHKIDIDHADGVKLGVRVTPTFFVNGVMLDQIGYEAVKAAVDGALAGK